jgi:hypothetical protein
VPYGALPTDALIAKESDNGVARQGKYVYTVLLSRELQQKTQQVRLSDVISALVGTPEDSPMAWACPVAIPFTAHSSNMA